VSAQHQNDVGSINSLIGLGCIAALSTPLACRSAGAASPTVICAGGTDGHWQKSPAAAAAAFARAIGRSKRSTTNSFVRQSRRSRPGRPDPILGKPEATKFFSTLSDSRCRWAGGRSSASGVCGCGRAGGLEPRPSLAQRAVAPCAPALRCGNLIRPKAQAAHSPDGVAFPATSSSSTALRLDASGRSRVEKSPLGRNWSARRPHHGQRRSKRYRPCRRRRPVRRCACGGRCCRAQIVETLMTRARI